MPLYMLFIFNTRWWSTHTGSVIDLLAHVPLPRGMLVGGGIPEWSRGHTKTVACSTVERIDLVSRFLCLTLLTPRPVEFMNSLPIDSIQQKCFLGVDAQEKIWPSKNFPWTWNDPLPVAPKLPVYSFRVRNKNDPIDRQKMLHLRPPKEAQTREGSREMLLPSNLARTEFRGCRREG